MNLSCRAVVPQPGKSNLQLSSIEFTPRMAWVHSGIVYCNPLPYNIPYCKFCDYYIYIFVPPKLAKLVKDNREHAAWNVLQRSRQKWLTNNIILYEHPTQWLDSWATKITARWRKLAKHNHTYRVVQKVSPELMIAIDRIKTSQPSPIWVKKFIWIFIKLVLNILCVTSSVTELFKMWYEVKSVYIIICQSVTWKRWFMKKFIYGFQSKVFQSKVGWFRSGFHGILRQLMQEGSADINNTVRHHCG